MTIRGSLGGAFRTMLSTVGFLAGVLFVAVALNWALLLYGLLPYLRAAGDQAAVARPLSTGLVVLVLGVAFPVGYLFAAQPLALRRAGRRLYAEHRQHALALVAGAVEKELGQGETVDPGRLQRALEAMRLSVEDQPAMLRPVVRVAFREAGVGRLEEALVESGGSVRGSLAKVIDEQLEDRVSGGGFVLGAVAVANVLAVAAVVLLSRG
jgi:hypothetical protein